MPLFRCIAGNRLLQSLMALVIQIDLIRADKKGTAGAKVSNHVEVDSKCAATHTAVWARP
jgi:hypothetical protein